MHRKSTNTTCEQETDIGNRRKLEKVQIIREDRERRKQEAEENRNDKKE